MPRIYVRIPPEERVWRHIDKNTCIGHECGCHKGIGHCWPWTGHIGSWGYGTMTVRIGGKGISVLTHRITYQSCHGRIPDGLCVLHYCDVRRCCRDSHLWLGTRADNNADAFTKKRRAFVALQKNLMPAGHPRRAKGTKIWTAKLTELDVIEIFKLQGSMSRKALAHMKGISKNTLRSILQRRIWKHVNIHI